MNLKDYFQQQQQNHISDTDKMNVYQSFMNKKMKSHYARKRSFLHIKSFVYSSFVMCILFGFYGMHFFNNQNPDYEGLTMNSDNAVQADFIAKVFDFNGSFYVEHAGQRVQTSNLQDGDVITLQENTQLIVYINSDTKAKLIGPAQFSIFKVGTGKDAQYKLNVIYGDFIEMKSLQQKPTNKVQLTIQDVLSVQQTSSKPIDFQLIKTGEKRIVKNNGGSLLVTTLDQNHKQIKTNLNKEQVLAFQKQDVTLFKNVQEFAKAVTQGNVSQIFTYNIYKDTIQNQTGADETIKEIPLNTLLDAPDQTIDQSISNQLGGLYSDAQKVPNEQQTQAISSSLNPTSLLYDLKSMYLNIGKGDNKSANASLFAIEKRVRQLYEIFNMKYAGMSVDGTLSERIASMKKSILSFVDTVNKGYMLPPKYFDSLYILVNWLTYMGEQSSQQAGESLSGNIEKNRENLLNALPKNLSF